MWHGFIFLLAFYVVKSCLILSKFYILFSTRTNILLETYFKVWAKFDNFLLHKKLTRIWSHVAEKRKGLLKWILDTAYRSLLIDMVWPFYAKKNCFQRNLTQIGFQIEIWTYLHDILKYWWCGVIVYSVEKT